MFKTILQSLFIGALALAQNPVPSNQLKFGDGTATDKKLIFNRGSSNPQIRWSESTSTLQFSNDSVNFSDLGSGSGSGSGFNVLTNPDFENGVSQGWSNTGGTFVGVNSGANLLFGKGSATFSAGAGNFLTSSLYAIPNGLTGQNCTAGMWYKGGDANLKFQILDGSSNVLNERVLGATSVATPFYLSFVCPSSGSFQLKIIASASSALLAIDRMFLGESNLIPISQSTFVGSIHYVPVASCNWVNNGPITSFANFTAVSACNVATAEGIASAPATKQPAIHFATLPPGVYYLVATGAMLENGGNGSNHGWRFSDGTNFSQTENVYGNSAVGMKASPLTGRLSYTTAQNDITIQVQNFCDGTDFCAIQNDDNRLTGLQIDVYRYPTTQEMALKPDMVANSWSGYHDKDCGWDTASTTMADFPVSDSSCTFVQRTNTNFGSVKSMDDGTPGNNLPGIVFTPSRPGAYYVCAHFPSENGTTQQALDTRLTDGTVEISTSDIRQAGSGGAVGWSTTALCGIYRATGVSPVTLKIQGATYTTGTGSIANNASTAGSRTIEWSIFQIDQSLPAPLLVNTVVTPSSGVEVVVRAKIAEPNSVCTSDPCVITSQTGSWLTVVNRGGTGAYTAHIAPGTFSAPPTCSIWPKRLSVIFYAPYYETDATTTTLDWGTYNNANTITDSAADIICVGPK